MKTKICFICKTGIDKNKPYCKVTEYNKDNDIKSKGYYHIECFRKRMGIGDESRVLLGMAGKMMEKANRLISPDKDKVVKI